MSFLILTGTEENVKVAENLQKCWNVIEPNAEQNGLFLFRFVLQMIVASIKEEYCFFSNDFWVQPHKGDTTSFRFCMCGCTI